MSEFTDRSYRAFHAHRRPLALAIYAVAAAVSYAGAYLLRFDLRWPAAYTTLFALSLPILLASRMLSSSVFRLMSGRWRFVGTRDVLRLVATNTAGTLVFYGVTRALPLPLAIPRSIFLIEWGLTTFLIAGLWLGYRIVFEQLRIHRSGFNGSAKRILIVGAGEAGSLVAREMRRYPTGYRLVGFVDDDPDKWGTLVHGVEVLGPTRDIADMAKALDAEEIVIAVPSASPRALREIVERCETTELNFKVLPGIAEVLAGEVRLTQLRDIQIEDLLGRAPVQLELPELEQDLSGRSILITGAAGSIGSELASQIALHGPATLVLFDQAETPLFYLDLELRERFPHLRIVPIVGDIVDAEAVERVMLAYRPERIFHAAAYKHVPMMEQNPREAVRTNVVGTWRVAVAAGQHGCEKFILVSTDKAVQPTSVMGATKHLAELLILELQDRFPGTGYGAVRFGNVLGSNGSVIPIFRKQLEEGRPLTVTDPDVTRYFMTIPEAVQLILQASVLPELRGGIAMLDMGEPVRILDLARNLLRLAGRPATGGAGITFTGLRPGEKMHEALVAADEETVPTSVAKVRLVTRQRVCDRSVLGLLSEWAEVLQDARDPLMVAWLDANSGSAVRAQS